MQAERVVIDIHSRISALSILYIAVNEREYPPKVPNASLLGYAVSTNPCMADLCFFFCHELISCFCELLLHNVTQIGQVIETFLQRIVDSRALLHQFSEQLVTGPIHGRQEAAYHRSESEHSFSVHSGVVSSIRRTRPRDCLQLQSAVGFSARGNDRSPLLTPTDQQMAKKGYKRSY